MRAILSTAAAALAIAISAVPASAQKYDGNAIIKFGAFGQYGSIGVQETLPAVGSGDRDGFQGGVSAGIDFILPYRWLLGVEIDGSMGDARGFVGTTDYGLDYMFNIRGRAGFFVHPNLLVYGTGGVSWLGYEAQQQGVGSLKASETATGWVAGGGIEYAIHSVILFGEYLHAEYGSNQFDLGGVPHRADLDADIFRIGVKFKVGHDYSHMGEFYEPAPLK